MSSLTGRRALVTGGARGIGRAIADALILAGARVTVCDVRAEPGDISVDVSNADHVRRLVDESGPIDVLINNAGIVRRTPPTDDWEKAITDFDEIIGTNLRGAFLVGRAVIPGMVAGGGGDIVNVATDHIHTCGWPTPVDHADAPDCPFRHTPRPPGGGASMDVYDASKWALTGLTQAWSAALGRHHIRVNTLCVGATDTAMLRSFLPHEPDPALVESWLRPAEVAGVVLDLLREGPTGRSGQNIGVWPGHPLPSFAEHS